ELKRHLSAVEQSFYKTAAQQNVPSGLYYLDTFQFHWNIFNRASKVVSMADFMQKLLATDLELDRLYIVHKLKIYISWLIFSGFRSTDDEMVIITGFWDYLTHAQFKDEPLIRIYLDIVDALKNLEEEQYYRELMRNLEKYGDSISKDDLRECYYFAQNYCAFKVNQGKIEYYREVFEIFRRIIQMGLLLEENQVSEGVYKNIITASLGVGEFKWAENFIRDYSGYLPPAIRENAMSYNLSYLYFNQKEYSRVIELLRDVEYSDVSYALSAKVLLLRTYYELGEMIALDSLIDSFRIYLRRNKVISKRLKRESNNFLNFLKRLAVLEDKKITGTSALKKRIMENPSIVSKKWLLEKVDEMENRH
ncbi:MAG TPA: hypothetical protein PKL15_08665, partial [Saprospiraceae bacterium]|nr:hypothetical protein [Saprospiraceae bacterium]